MSASSASGRDQRTLAALADLRARFSPVRSVDILLCPTLLAHDNEDILENHQVQVYADYAMWRKHFNGLPPCVRDATKEVPPAYDPYNDSFAEVLCPSAEATPSRVTVLVQSYRAPFSLRSSMKTWRATFLQADYVCGVMFYFNDRTEDDDIVAHEAMDGTGIEYKIFGDNSNKHLAYTIHFMAAQACSPVVLFLEKDWHVRDGSSEYMLKAMAAGYDELTQGGVDLVMFNNALDYKSPHAWPCGTKNQLLTCTLSRFQPWSNNPFMARAEWLVQLFGFWSKQFDSSLYSCHPERRPRHYVDIEELFLRRVIPWVTSNWVIALQPSHLPFHHLDIDGHGKNY